MDVGPSGGGSVKINQTTPSSFPATFTFANGESVRLEATPASGYRFDNWSGDLSGTTNPASMVIDCKKMITAKFSQIMHTLTMQVSGSGSTTPAVGTHNYREGTVVSITAIPDSGWQFDSWTGGIAEPNMANTIVTIDSDEIVAAKFSEVKPSWWFVGGIIAGVIIISVSIWFAARRQTA